MDRCRIQNSERIGKPIRKHVRIEVRLGIRFIIEGDPSRAAYEGLTKNISRSGACLQAQQGKDQLIAATAGRMPKLEVSLYIRDEDHPIDVRTQTAWISSKVGWFMTPSSEELPVLVGMAFEDLSAEDAVKIDNLIEECLFKSRESVQEQELRILSRFNARGSVRVETHARRAQ